MESNFKQGGVMRHPVFTNHQLGRTIWTYDLNHTQHGHHFVLKQRHHHDVVRFQVGDPRVVGYNGFYTEDLLRMISFRLSVLQKQIPCEENTVAIAGVEAAIKALDDRALRIKKQQNV